MPLPRPTAAEHLSRARPRLVLSPHHLNSRFTLDVRHLSDSVLAQTEEYRKTFSNFAVEDSERGVSLEWRQVASNPAVTLRQDCITVIEQAAEETRRSTRVS